MANRFIIELGDFVDYLSIQINWRRLIVLQMFPSCLEVESSAKENFILMINDCIIYDLWHTYIHTRVHTHTHIHAFTHTHTYTHSHTHTRVHTHPHTHIHAFTYTHTRAYTHSHRHIHAFTPTHTHMYVYLQIYHGCEFMYVKKQTQDMSFRTIFKACSVV